MVSFEFGSGDRVAWQIEGTAQNFYLHYKWQERLEAAGFPCKLFPYQQNMKDGGRHSALSREWTFSTEHCEQTKLDTADTAILLRRLIDLLQSEGDDHGAAIADFNRITIESAMDALDRYRETGEGDEIFDYFGEPRDYWVRSSRERGNRVYPTKPIVGFIKKKTELNGGWGQKGDAAAALHNAGFIIVDQDDKPVSPPERYDHLIRDADRIRLCALNSLPSG